MANAKHTMYVAPDTDCLWSTSEHIRLAGQMARVFWIMADGKWHTLSEIQQATGGRDSEAGISARLRDFRKTRYGAHVVERRLRKGNNLVAGLREYRLRVNPLASLEINNVKLL